MSIKGFRRGDALIAVLFIATVCWGLATWYKKHQGIVATEEAKKARTAAKTEQAKAALARLRAKWNADVFWEKLVYPPDNGAPSYSLDIERALENGRPIIVIGEIQDVQSDQGQSAPVVLIRSHTSRNLVDLRFSLVTTPDVANSILAATRNNPLARVETFISVATIQRTERIARPPDNADSEQDYFLAHGILHETYDTHLFVLQPKDLGEH